MASGFTFRQLIGKFLGNPLLQRCQTSLLLVELSDLVADDCKQVEADFVASIVLNPCLDFLACEGQPCLFSAFTVGDWACLQSIELVQCILVRDEADEVEDVVILSGHFGFFIHDKGILSLEAIVHSADSLRVANGVTSLLRRQGLGETFELSKFGSNFNLRTVHKDRQNSLRGAGIIDNLVSKE